MILAIAIAGWLVSSTVLGWSLIKANQRVRDARRAAEHPTVQFTFTSPAWETFGNGAPYYGEWDNPGPPLRLVDDA